MSPTRRQFLVTVTGLAAAMTAAPAFAQSGPAAMSAAIVKVTGGAKVQTGKVKLDVPPLSENGNAVAMNVTVDSPMSATDYVKAIHVFTEKNPQPNVISIRLGPRAGVASIQTRMRLADTQTVVAIAEMSDGSFWQDSGDVVVTLGACLEDNL
ncbi:MAG: SoxY-related AACIE arm protein [Pseudomonadota bacterium]